jgi:hypothetical protein
MKVRITLQRAIQQFADYEVERVASVQEAEQQVDDQLKDPLTRARLLAGLVWHILEETEPITLAEITEQP